MTHSNKSTNPLRQRMIDDMTLRKLAPKTQAGYLRAVMKFTRFFARSPDLASPEDLRAFQLQLVETGVSSTTINATTTRKPPKKSHPPKKIAFSRENWGSGLLRSVW